MTATAIIANENIQGNVSNCTYQNVLIDSGRKQFFQFYTKQTYSVINVCDKSVLSTYKEFRPTAEVISLIFMVVMGIIGWKIYRYSIYY